MAREGKPASVQRAIVAVAADRPQAPCDWLPQSGAVDPAAKRRLREIRRKLDPFALKEAIERALRRILAQPLHSSRPTGSLRSEAALAKAENITN
ncbi:hypothetical protein [Verrucomicrobium sp. 3C]|uniref:hypothetical protein n=1 Tax=Verrucomicrobium sp. 3C TaxID=1134055 RepID=UPI000378545A|nr:hypothetical protein [Verrucomicrobium sp. 3C]